MPLVTNNNNFKIKNCLKLLKTERIDIQTENKNHVSYLCLAAHNQMFISFKALK